MNIMIEYTFIESDNKILNDKLHNFKHNLDLTPEAFYFLTNIAIDENKELGDLTIIFCDDNYLLEKNMTYLNHDSYTDVITFDYSNAKNISGDIFVSFERVKENAEIYNTNFYEEIKRVIIHGLLHLLGYKDKHDADLKEMRRKENLYLSKWEGLNNIC